MPGTVFVDFGCENGYFYNEENLSMINIIQGEWIADLGGKVCRNINKKITVCFERRGKTYIGKVKDMPLELMEQWAKIPDGYKLFRKTVKEAEKVYLRAYIESKL